MITEGAVQKHVTSIFAKLGLRGGEDANRRVLAVLAYLNPDRDKRRAERRLPRPGRGETIGR